VKTALACLLFALCSTWAAALEPLWSYDTVSPSPVVPLVTDYNNDGALNVLVPTQHDGRVCVLTHEGQELQYLMRPQWINGPVASIGLPGQFVFEESTGRVALLDYRNYKVFSGTVAGVPLMDAGPCVADLDADGSPEVICVRQNGVVTALDLKLAPLWQYDTGAPVSAPPAVAPVFADAAGVYVLSDDGILHAVNGDGAPLWRFHVATPPDARIPGCGPIVVQFPARRAAVLVADGNGSLYAVDAVNGEEHWRTRIGDAPLGTPAIVDVTEHPGAEIVVAGEHGGIAVLDASGAIVRQGALPRAEYVPRPLVADVDGDHDLEVLVATRDWSVLVASLDGAVEQTLPLRGNACGGLLLADLDRDGDLELLASTDCARLHCFATKATVGWTHPRAGNALNGAVAPIFPSARPHQEEPKRRVRTQAFATGDFEENVPFATAHVRPRKRRSAQSVSAVVRIGDLIVGATHQTWAPQGLSIPFVRRTQEPVVLDLAFHDEAGETVAVSKTIPVRSAAVRLVELTPLDDFYEALGRRAGDFAAPAQWRLPTVAGRDTWHATHLTKQQWERYGLEPEAFISKALPGASYPDACAEIGGDLPCAPLQFALRRGAGRQRGGRPWGVSLNNRFRDAVADTGYRSENEPVRWTRPARASGPHCGHSPSLEFRLAMAAHLAGATFLRHQAHTENGSILVQETAPGRFALSPLGTAVKAWHTYTEAFPRRGVPYTPIALVANAPDEGRVFEPPPSRDAQQRAQRAVAALLRHAFSCNSVTDFEHGYLTSVPYAQVFDVATAPDAACLGGYGVVWLLGEASPSAAQRDALVDYAERGGILVLDASWAAGLPGRLLGVRFTRKAAVATQIQTALAPACPLTAPCAYRPMTLSRKTQALAWTDSGDPLLVWRAVKQGLIILLAADHWLDEAGHLLPLAPALLHALTEAFLPVDVLGDVLTFFNRTDTGWVIGVINNNGIRKLPTERAVADPKEAADCFLRFKQGVPLRFTSRLGEFRWNNLANGLHVRLRPGEVAVVEVIFGGA